MSSGEFMLSEYLKVQDMIESRIAKIETLLNSAIVSILTIFTIAYTSNHFKLLLMPYAIIIPISIRISHHRDSIARMSAYQMSLMHDEEEYFLGNTSYTCWEGFNHALDQEQNHYKWIDRFYNNELLILALVCSFVTCLSSPKEQQTMMFRFSLSLLFIELLITCSNRPIQSRRKRYKLIIEKKQLNGKSKKEVPHEM